MVSILVALALMRTDGDPAEALRILGDLSDIAVPESIEELDCVAIGSQAIREAAAMNGRAVSEGETP